MFVTGQLPPAVAATPAAGWGNTWKTPRCANRARYQGDPIMRKASMLGTIAGAALLTAAPLSLQWSQQKVALALDSADARIGRPLTATSIAGVNRRANRRAYRRAVYAGVGGAAVGYGLGSYYGGYSSAPSWGTGYGSYYGDTGYSGYSGYSSYAPTSPNWGTGYSYGSYYGDSYPGYAGYRVYRRPVVGFRAWGW